MSEETAAEKEPREFLRYLVIPDFILAIDNDKLGWFEKILWARIHSLCNNTGHYCWASNSKIGEILGVSAGWVSRGVSELARHGLIKVELIRDEYVGTKRRIRTILKGSALPPNSSTLPISETGEGDNPIGSTSNKNLERNAEIEKLPITQPTSPAGKSLKNGRQTERETLSDSPPKAGTEKEGGFSGSPSPEAGDAFRALRAAAGLLPREREFSMREDPGATVDAVVSNLAKKVKTNPHTFGYENKKTIESRFKKAICHKAILTGEVGLAELKTKRKTKKESK